MRAIILLFANILFSSIPGKYRDNAESFAINKYTSEHRRKCQSYKIFESSKVSTAHFERWDRNACLNPQTLDGTNSIWRLVELYQISTNKGSRLDESSKNPVRIKEHDWLDCTEKDGGQDGTVTMQQVSIILIM